MSRKVASSLALYSIAATVILGWWVAAFLPASNATPVTPSAATEQDNRQKHTPSHLLFNSPNSRQSIQKALAGDFALMARFIAEWDLDAQILKRRGIPGIARLPLKCRDKARTLARVILTGTQAERDELIRGCFPSTVTDDDGHTFMRDAAPGKSLPQTYAAASILLALAPPETLSAIPEGIRKQTALYPRSLTDQVPLNSDRYNGEEISLSHPSVAFVADYSHPATLQALQKQGIPLFMIKNVDTLSGIVDAISRIGRAAQRPLEAELLALFMDSTLLAIDNALAAAASEYQGRAAAVPAVLFASYYAQFSVPGEKHLAGKLIQRLAKERCRLFVPDGDRYRDWSIPIMQEEIAAFNPDCLIVAAEHGEALLAQISSYPTLAALPAARNGHLYAVDAELQAPSQYIILAYYDLAKALASFFLRPA